MATLITSGGTKVPIDRVRSITNMSKGTFGAKIAQQFLDCTTDQVEFLAAKGSKRPEDWRDEPRLITTEYETFDQYKDELEFRVHVGQPEIIILAAAVSDYGVASPVDGKIRSKDQLTIQLTPLPKVIAGVRKLAPKAVICGFKLLVDSTDEELVRAGVDSLAKNDLDLVVCNDLRDIKQGNHRLHVVERLPNNNYSHNYRPSLFKLVGVSSGFGLPDYRVTLHETDPQDPGYLAMVVMVACMGHVRHFADQGGVQ